MNYYFDSFSIASSNSFLISSCEGPPRPLKMKARSILSECQTIIDVEAGWVPNHHQFIGILKSATVFVGTS